MNLQRLLVFVLPLGMCIMSYAAEPDVGCRRYVSFSKKHGEIEYFLLATKEVQRELQLSPDQAGALRATVTGSLSNAPFVQEVKSKYEKRLQDPLLSAPEKKKLKLKKNHEFTEALHRYNCERIGKILTDEQKTRMDQLLLQMNGPAEIVLNKELAAKLGITHDQQSRMKDICDGYDGNVKCYYQRLMQITIQDVRHRPAVEIEKEKKSIACVIEEIEKDRDFQLYAVLNEDQKIIWNTLAGKPLCIKWNAPEMFEVPFAQE